MLCWAQDNDQLHVLVYTVMNINFFLNRAEFLTIQAIVAF